MTKSFVLFCSAQDSESTDMNCLRTLQKWQKLEETSAKTKSENQKPNWRTKNQNGDPKTKTEIQKPNRRTKNQIGEPKTKNREPKNQIREPKTKSENQKPKWRTNGVWANNFAILLHGQNTEHFILADSQSWAKQIWCKQIWCTHVQLLRQICIF